MSNGSQLFQGLSPEEVCERWPSWRDNCNVLFTLGFNVEDITTILLKVTSAALASIIHVL